MNCFCRIKTRRTIILSLFMLFAAILSVVVVAMVFCARNSQVRDEWGVWTNHLSGPPSSWSQPSNDLHRFQIKAVNTSDENGNSKAFYGYKNQNGETVILPKFSMAGERFYFGVAWVYDPEIRQYGYINPDGSWRVIVNGSAHSDFVGGMGKFQVIGSDGYPLYGFININGDESVPATYIYAKSYVNDFVLVGSRTWIGWVTDQLNSSIETSFDSCLGKKLKILDRNGQAVKLPLGSSSSP